MRSLSELALQPTPSSYTVARVRVVDGLGNPMLQDGFVRIEGDRIAAVGPAADLPAGVEAFEAPGLTLLPGLIDAHTHLFYSGFRSVDSIATCSPELAALNSAANAWHVLRAGFTTVREVGTIGEVSVRLRDLVDRGELRGPRIVASGRIITASGGPLPGRPPGSEAGGFAVWADGPAEMLKAVRQQLGAGVDNVKLMASGLELHPSIRTTDSVLTEAEIRVAVEEAHRWGRTVAVHCQSFEAATSALRAGADTIEHGTRLDEESLGLFLSSRSVLVPTLSTLYSVLELGDSLGLLPKQRQEMEENFPVWRRSLAAARKAGVPIAVGGDIGNRYPHGTNARELELLVREGFTPMEAMVAATSMAARAVGRAADLGTVQAGKLADMILVEGNPLADIKVLQDLDLIRLVIQGGRPVAGAELEQARLREHV